MPNAFYSDNVLPYLKQYWSDPTLAARALTPSYPGTFQADVAAGTLAQVTVVPGYPVTVNSVPPPQEPGTPRRPSGPVTCPT